MTVYGYYTMISSNGKRTFLLGLFLAVVTLGLYWQATDYEFVAFDDDQYVYQNPWVTSGLSMATIKWALTSTFAANWHPVTWISHLIDYSIYGPFAGGHHFTSILLHALNTALLFILLSRLTGALWPAALVAALFGWHPLRVESVAWIAERKDVLSALFFMLTLWAYARAKLSTPHSSLFTQNWLALVFFALGLMSKPMVVTLPFVLLLLDYWPLGRMSEARGRRTEVGGQKSDWKRMVIEKVPFFILSAG